MLIGYIAELKFRQLWLDNPDITASFKHDDHNRKGKGDRVITYKGHEFVFEVKSLQTNSIRVKDGVYRGSVQVDASDNRTIILDDGSLLKTTCLKIGEFDILVANIYAFTQEWKFLFAKNIDLPRSNHRAYSEYQKSQLLATSVKVSYPPEPPFVENPFPLLEELIHT